MLNKNVCPNCGQIYETNLAKCPLCGAAPQVVEPTDPAQRKPRRTERKEAESEDRRRGRETAQELPKDGFDGIRRNTKQDLGRGGRGSKAGSIPNSTIPVFTPGPAQDGRGPMPLVYAKPDRRRVPRIFLVLSTIVLATTLLVGGSYLLWKLEVAKIPFYDELAAKKEETTEATEATQSASGIETPQTESTVAATLFRGEGAIPCTGITLSQTALVLDEEGAQIQLQTELLPEDTTDERRFSSSDSAVVKVSPVGLVTAIGPGEAVITVSCGEIQVQCPVSCTFPQPTAPTIPADVTKLVLIKDDMTFRAPGENYLLSVTNIPSGTPVDWESLDESVATVDERGHVVAVGNGTTRVFARVGDLETFCWVRCRFEDD